jgi:hypothetical protein
MVSLPDTNLPGFACELAETGMSSSKNGSNRRRNLVFKETSRE